MASRNIANMHLFLEMKKKFPDLPEDTLRNYVLLYSQDQDKCVSLLQKESKNHFHTTQLFSDFRQLENKPKSAKNDNKRMSLDPELELTNPKVVYLHTNSYQLPLKKKMPDPPRTSVKKSHAYIAPIPMEPSNFNVALKPEAKSAPVISNNENPFTDMYRSAPITSHTTLYQVPTDQNADSRMMFSTTKEHTILPPELKEVKPSSERHAVQLSIIPSFPFPQQQMNVYTSTICSTAQQSSKPGRHTTSLNLQLQPHTSNTYPVEISTIPTNIGSPCNPRDFGSHLQISVGAQGATITALRLQRPQVPPGKPPGNQLLGSAQASCNFTESSSQTKDSQVYIGPDRPQKVACVNLSPSTKAHCNNIIWETDNEYQSKSIGEAEAQSDGKFQSGQLNAQTNFCHGFQASPDYIQAVKKHQIARLGLLQEELSKEKTMSSNLNYEVNDLEQKIVRRQEKENTFSYEELLKKIKEENRKLRVECNCLLMEYDVSSNGQIPVGMTDMDFYSNIFTGPNDSLALYSNHGRRTSRDEYPQAVAKESSSHSEEADDEKNRWKCKKCTFANHPALEKCEMCELPKNSGSFFDDS